MSGLYPTLLRILREAATPLTHQELFHHPDIQAYGVDSVRVSDYLGNLWRRGEVRRVSAAAAPGASGRARYAYEIANTSKKLADVNSSTPYVVQLLERGGIKIEDYGSYVVVTNERGSIHVYPDKIIIA